MLVAHTAMYFLFLSIPQCCHSAHIIGVPSMGISHGRVLVKIGVELVKRGHKYSLLVPSDLEKDFLLPNGTSPVGFQVKSFKSNFTKLSLEALMLKQSAGQVDELWLAISNLWLGTCEDMLTSEIYVQPSLSDVDFMLCDIGLMCCPILADFLGIQRVDISPTGFGDPFLSMTHNFPNPLAYIPQMPYWLPRKLSFLSRVQNFLLYNLCSIVYHFYLIVPHTKIWMKHVTNSKHRNLEALCLSTGLLLIPMDFALTTPRPLAPHVKVIGPILPEPAKPLPLNFLKDIPKDYKHLVVVSFGTVITNFNLEFIVKMATALSELPLQVIWKHNGTMPINIGTNVKIFPWIPQNDLLGNPATKLFITHGGLNSIYEATFHGVPMVVIPFFGDQFDNACNVQEAGIGEMLILKNLKAGQITEIAMRVLTDTRYAENARIVSGRILYPGKKSVTSQGQTHIQPMIRTPTQQAADWVEYGLVNNAALHLRSEADNLSFIQLYLIDVILFVVVMSCLLLQVIYFVVRCVVFKVCPLKRNFKFKPD